MTLFVLALIGLALALLPASLFAINVILFRRLPPASTTLLPAMSVLIPARNEALSIVGAIESILANTGVEFELLILDDHSEDDTATLVTNIAARDPRVSLHHAPPLPTGWCGKQHACHVLAGLARQDLLVWLDADVRLSPDALARIASWMIDHPNVGLLSGFPRQQTGTFFEKLLIPLIHFILLGFLPLPGMRSSPRPSLGAGCGQLFIARRRAYGKSGGHAAIRSSLHDGITLPRAFRSAGIATDIFDATDTAHCRMYRSGSETWNGLAKNATEGMAAPFAIYVWTVLLIGGQVLPWVIAIIAIGERHLQWRQASLVLTTISIALLIAVRIVTSIRYRQPSAITLLHPLAIVTLLAVQWHARLRSILGRSAEWKGRSYSKPHE